MMYDKNHYLSLKDKYLAEAELLFGPKTDYIFDGLYFEEGGPEVHYSMMAKAMFETAFMVKLAPIAQTDYDSGILQISHEVIHLLSPVELTEDDMDISYLEEGLAVQFSKLITERDTGNLQITDIGMDQKPGYRDAYDLYCELVKTEPDAIRKLRAYSPVIDEITEQTFKDAGLNVDKALIAKLLRRFPRQE